MIEQRVGNGWKCDGCGRVFKWDDASIAYGSMAEEDEGLVRWVACSGACAETMPQALKYFTTRIGEIPDHVRAEVEKLRELGGWRAARGSGETP